MLMSSADQLKIKTNCVKLVYVRASWLSLQIHFLSSKQYTFSFVFSCARVDFLCRLRMKTEMKLLVISLASRGNSVSRERVLHEESHTNTAISFRFITTLLRQMKISFSYIWLDKCIVHCLCQVNIKQLIIICHPAGISSFLDRAEWMADCRTVLLKHFAYSNTKKQCIIKIKWIELKIYNYIS